MLAACVLLGASLVTGPALAQPRSSTPAVELPPLSYTCPMHPDVIESGPGTCPICKMSLVGVRLVSVWTCPVHPVITAQKAGQCPIDHRELVQATMALSWTCAGRTDINQLTRGTCPDGSNMVATYAARPHGSHNPQHGGQFFMAPDNWHHLEGAYPRAGVVRIYLYDDYSRPLPLDQQKHVVGRVVTRETFDASTRATKEIAAFPLALTRNGQYLEAKVDARALPAQATAKIRFKDDGPEYRFDFTFTTVSREPIAVAARAASAPGNQTASLPPGTVPPGVDPSQVPLPIPDTVEQMVDEIGGRNRQLRELIDRGRLAELYVPAFQAKDLALAIEAHGAQLAPSTRVAIAPAIAQIVRTAWRLDAAGDLGDRQQILEVYALFTEAVSTVESLIPKGPGTPGNR